jgi:hypothetical protein
MVSLPVAAQFIRWRASFTETNRELYVSPGGAALDERRVYAAPEMLVCNLRMLTQWALSHFAGNQCVRRSSPENPWGFSTCGVSVRLKEWRK